ncbi:hypothetical protein BC828DRAFT_393666 [Blastocladiella britannica]|nr:hypothetical protein BC828DRAFT_393666 [Blastocladiella britannica]
MARPILFSLLLAVLLALTANAQVTVSSSTSTSTSTTTAHSSTSTSTTAKPTPTATSTSTQQPPKPTDPAVQPLPLSILATPRRGVCKKQCVRKEVNSMSDDEWNRYAGAIKQLNQGQGGSQMTVRCFSWAVYF